MKCGGASALPNRANSSPACARQHFQSLCSLLANLSYPNELQTSSLVTESSLWQEPRARLELTLSASERFFKLLTATGIINSTLLSQVKMLTQDTSAQSESNDEPKKVRQFKRIPIESSSVMLFTYLGHSHQHQIHTRGRCRPGHRICLLARN